ncbi:hypothetical protein XaC1_493 [Xanthomonas phage XaC1]|nr:hypothetical protein XaC1_493 [Xanthomonas phage XaC1]
MKKPRKLRISNALKSRLHTSVLQGRRSTVYKMIAKKLDGQVLCYVCGRYVKEQHASLEHIMPLSHGGTDSMDNLWISHNACNSRRGNDLDFPCSGIPDGITKLQ